MMANNEKLTILYGRLSQEDDRDGESNSIGNQRLILEKYAEEKSFENIRFLYDDGFSGTNFNRPSWNEIMALIESNQVATLIVKDLSRLGRDHLQVGHYTEIYFPLKNVRYIAINDNVDTANKNNDIAPLKNVMNEFYSRDNSRKIKASIRARSKAGMYRSAFSPLGYRKAPDNKNKLLVDEETAHIVRHIFQLVLDGSGPHAIVSILRKEQVPCPSWWLHSRGEKDYSERFSNPANKYEWSHTVIRNIIRNPIYLGSIVMCKTETIFKARVSRKTAEDERIRVDGTHEPLISQEDFIAANDKILSRKREDCSGNVSIFSGLLKCGTCGKAMTQRYWTKKSHLKIFVCGTYAANTKACTDHRIFYDDLYTAVLTDIRENARLSFQDRQAAVDKAMRDFSKQYTGKSKTNESKLRQAKKRYDDVTRMFDKLYEDSLEGRISNANFTRLIGKYQAEQEELLSQMAALEKELKDKTEASINAERWADEIAKYTDMPELTAEILNRLIKRIEVFSRTDDNGVVSQEIHIVYRFGDYITNRAFMAKMLTYPKGDEGRMPQTMSFA